MLSLMIMFFRYIFYTAYYFCINVFKEKEFPQTWAGGIISILITINLIVLLEIFAYNIFPSKIKTISEYYKYFGIFLFGLTFLYINKGKRYLKILKYYEIIPDNKKKVFRILSIFYYILSAVCLYIMVELVREYNINNP